MTDADKKYLESRGWKFDKLGMVPPHFVCEILLRAALRSTDRAMESGWGDVDVQRALDAYVEAEIERRMNKATELMTDADKIFLLIKALKTVALSRSIPMPEGLGTDCRPSTEAAFKALVAVGAAHYVVAPRLTIKFTEPEIPE